MLKLRSDDGYSGDWWLLVLLRESGRVRFRAQAILGERIESPRITLGVCQIPGVSRSLSRFTSTTAVELTHPSGWSSSHPKVSNRLAAARGTTQDSFAERKGFGGGTPFILRSLRLSRV